MFQNPCGQPFVTLFSILKLFIVMNAFLPLGSLVWGGKGFGGTLRLAVLLVLMATRLSLRLLLRPSWPKITTLPLFSWSSLNFLASIATSILFFCGVNPYWSSFKNSVLCKWCIILLISSFSRTLPPVLIKLIGRYFDGSMLSSLPGLVIGSILALF